MGIFHQDLEQKLEEDTLTIVYKILKNNKNIDVINDINNLISVDKTERSKKLNDILNNINIKEEKEEDNRIL